MPRLLLVWEFLFLSAAALYFLTEGLLLLIAALQKEITLLRLSDAHVFVQLIFSHLVIPVLAPVLVLNNWPYFQKNPICGMEPWNVKKTFQLVSLPTGNIVKLKLNVCLHLMDYLMAGILLRPGPCWMKTADNYHLDTRGLTMCFRLVVTYLKEKTLKYMTIVVA